MIKLVRLSILRTCWRSGCLILWRGGMDFRGVMLDVLRILIGMWSLGIFKLGLRLMLKVLRLFSILGLRIHNKIL